jgi:hypothetical protein
MANITRTITFKTMSCLPQNFKKLVTALQKHRFREGKENGVYNFDDRGNYITGVLVTKIPVLLRSFDVDKLSVVRVRDEQYDVIPFGLDYSYATLEVYSSRSKLRLVESFLFDVSEGIGFTPFSVDIHRFFDLLQKRAMPFSLTTMRIKEFEFEQNLRGTFAPKVLETSAGMKLLKRFKDNIAMIGTKVRVDGTDVLLRLSPEGSISFSCDEESQQAVEVQLKRLLVEKKRLLE